MAERERKLIGIELLRMKLSREDLLIMICSNCTRAPKMAGDKTLLDICVNGMTYGAMESICPYCKIILHEDGDRYRCLAMLSMQNQCDYDQYIVKTAPTPWIIPQSVESQKLKEWKPRCENYKAKSFLNSVMTGQRKRVIDAINGHKKVDDNIKIINNGKTLYNYILVPRPDFIGKISHVVGQIQEDLRNPTLRTRFRFYRKEKVFKKGEDHSYLGLTREEAIFEFKFQFLNSSGIEWEDWLVEEPTRKKGRMFPLKIDDYSTLEYEKAEQVDDLHKQLLVTLDYLKKLEIEGKQIREELIDRAHNITVQQIQDAHKRFEFVKSFEEQGIDTSFMHKDDLSLRDDEKDRDLKSLSIIARLITLPGGTTLRLVDIQKCPSFLPIQQILGVFYCNGKWPSSVADITHEYMMHRTLMVIGNWIMELVFSSDEVHHHYVQQKHSSCYWSVLLRKAEKAFAEDTFDPLILCTMDFETVLDSDKKDVVITDKQMGTKRISLSKVDDIDYDNYGYLVHHENKNRVKLQMVFPVKYSERQRGHGPGPSDREQAAWMSFITKFYSGVHISADLKEGAKKIFEETKSPYIYCGKTWKSKIENTLK